MASNFRVDNLENTGSITIASGDLIMTGGIELTGDLSLLANSHLRFNSPGENDQFVFGNNNVITLDGDLGVILKGNNYVYHNINDENANLFASSYSIFNNANSNIDFRVKGGSSNSLINADAGEDSIAIGASELNPFTTTGIGQDVLVYLSGSTGTKDSSTRGVSLVSGDLVTSGAAYLQNDLFLTGNIYMTNASGDEINWENESDFVLTAQNKIVLKVDNDGDSSNSGVQVKDSGGSIQHILYEDGRAIFNNNLNSAGSLSVRGSTDYGLVLADLTNNIIGLGAFTNTINTIPGLGSDVKVLLSGSTGTKDTPTRGVTLVSGDMVVSGTTYFPSDVVVDANTRVYFDGTGNSGFGGPYIYGNTVALNIDGDNRLSLRYDDDLYVLDSSNSNVTFQLIDSAKTSSFSEFGDDIVAFISGSKGSKDQTGSRGAILFSGDTITSGSLHIDSGIRDKFTTKSSATGTVVHDCEESTVFNHSSISANFTANFTNLNLSSGYATSLTLILNQGATAYMATGVQIAGAAQTIEWQGGSTPSGTSSGIDVVSFSIINSAGTYTVLGQSVSYS